MGKKIKIYLLKSFIFLTIIISSLFFREAKRADTGMSDYCFVPPFTSQTVPPNVMFMLSIETPMQGAAHPDVTCSGNPLSSYTCQPSSCRYTVSGKHVSTCYDDTIEYYGYFNPNKCYSYVGGGTAGRFEPSGNVSNGHKCTGGWSGNFLNWATMMAVDAFRNAMTGGNRNVDAPGNTQLLGARQTLSPGDSWFPIKRIDSAGSYTPYSGTVYIIRYANGFGVCRDTNNDGLPDCGIGTTGSGENMFPTVTNKRCSNNIFKACNVNSDCGSGTCQNVSGAIAAFNLQIEVCNPAKGLERNCNPSNNKPEGVIQKYADKIRFGLISYAMKNNPDYSRDGGVIRANMKWITHKIPYGLKYHDVNGNLIECTNPNGCPNPEAEINADGTFITNPDNIGGASYSGVVNYINKFGYASGYKSYDPISEMYYEIIRYFKKLGPSTDRYCTNLDTIDDGAPVFCNSNPWSKTNKLGWRDPFIYPCQKSFVVAINDANPWLDKRIPGTRFTYQYSGANQNASDWGVPSNADNTIDVSYWTDLVGQHEGITPGYMCIGCVDGGTCDWSATSKYVSQLSKAAGTCPYPPKQNSYYIAGLAYYAHNTDLRPDLGDMQNLITYMIDTQESNPNMLVGRYNMLYLAAKFGGFDDLNNNGRPDLSSEWDKNNDGFPDNYFFASDPAKIEQSLVQAFTDILRRASSGGTVATLTSKKGFASLVLQPYFYPKYFADGREVNWIGFLRAFWVDFKSNLREDTVEAKWLNLWGTLVDKIFQMVSKEGEEPKAWMLNNETTCSASLSKPLSNLIPVFDAGCLLAERSGVDRAIYVNFNGTIKDIMESEVTNYLKSIWSEVAQNQGLIFQVDDQFTQCLIKFIKGEDIPSNCSSSTYGDYFKRNLTIPLNLFCPNSNLQGRWKLGDTGYSTPSIVSNAPNNNYDLLYFDSSYTSYIRDTSYRRRSSFIFIGANDGMLHAFRLGYFSDTGDVNKPLRLVDAFNSTSFANIGKEEWAFIPKNAIPYLVWYGHKDYCRIPIIDYRSLIIDASIGGDAQDNKTVNSWRTLLIGVMGFGGKELSNYSSSIFVLDLTDWLKGEANQPTLLWETTLPDKSLTLSFPVVVRRGDADKNGNWYVVIGSGPKNPQATSFVSNPKIYLFDLRNGNKQEIEIPSATSMAVSDLWAVDLDGDYQDDVVYFGTYNTASGNLYRLKLSDLSVSMAFKIERPIFAAPITGAGKSGQIWVYFGTGRFLDGNLDRTFTYNNYFVGFKDGCASGNCPAPYTLADLTDRTNFSYENRTALRTEQICLCEWEACSLKDVVVDATYGGGYPEEPTRGWYHKLTNDATHKEMIYSQPFIFGGNVETLLYRAVNDICKIEGETLLMALCYNTGALCPKPSLPTTQDYFNVVKIPIGPGAPPFGQPFQMSSLSGERGTYTKLVTISLATIEALKQQVQPGYQSRFILWIEK